MKLLNVRLAITSVSCDIPAGMWISGTLCQIGMYLKEFKQHDGKIGRKEQTKTIENIVKKY